MEQRLEILVRQRSALRMVFTKSLKNFDEAVQDGNVEATEITFSILEDKAGRFFKLDEEICQILAEDPGKEEALNSEIENKQTFNTVFFFKPSKKQFYEILFKSLVDSKLQIQLTNRFNKSTTFCNDLGARKSRTVRCLQGFVVFNFFNNCR